MADLSDSHSRGCIDERTALAALTIKSIAPQVKIIAELLDEAKKPHLQRTNVDEIIVRGEHLGSLLTSAIISTGIVQCIIQNNVSGKKKDMKLQDLLSDNT